ncbi:biotin--[acetyl-CoA-carboxylase] ligase [Helicobacter felis]|uniref:Biotin--[acetyl-CoA-carboxylase] synthetase n=1 Tax=Helicobacter felis (strain ATCC 49179 / CCUG 28539 / NCTC 12436 / CS1) TaxID=936155 RepID=E7AAM4_HELFC|nr:biotin--[acetyl-CoA-carboxylase] ligase [Helicobacter felis]CBY83544.1 putative biotin--[acetyl-CoA-carboxylase] synthetase [Helicobacter felis ATCC 49179]
MQIVTFETLPSTQLYLVEQVKCRLVDLPLCVVAEKQSAGVGSRGCAWDSVQEGLTFSFAIALSALARDVPRQSWSVYFGFLFKQSLQTLGQEVWLKWPNDLYKGTCKVGGIMTQIVHENLICGIGLNLQDAHYGALGALDKRPLLEVFLAQVEARLKWQEVIQAYRSEFSAHHRGHYFHHNGIKVFLDQARILEDGGLQIGDRVYYEAR